MTIPTRRLRSMACVLGAAAALAGAPSAHGATHYVANNGIDATLCGFFVIGGTSCGTQTSPCRSIRCAMAYADPGDTIIVGPGRYGDANADGDLADKGDELGSSGCACMLSVDKAVTLVSSHGAAATLIDAEPFTGSYNVRIAGAAEFGRPGKGFTVTSTGQPSTGGNGIVVDASDVQIRGNQVVARFPNTIFAVTLGIKIRNVGDVLVEGNQLLGGWGAGIEVDAGSSAIVRRNHVSGSLFYGIRALGEEQIIVGNLVTGAGSGIFLGDGAASVTGNASYGNADGIHVSHPSDFDVTRLTIRGNNLFGNQCGMVVSNLSGLNATNNYWGGADRPGDGSRGRTLRLHERLHGHHAVRDETVRRRPAAQALSAAGRCYSGQIG